MKYLDDFRIDHPVVWGLRIAQLVIFALSVLAFVQVGWMPLLIGVLVIIQFELTIIGFSLVYFLKRYCNDRGR